MGQRTSLQVLLESIATKVYFQPPSDISMVYPCIVYSRDSANTEFADGVPYSFEYRYMVTVMDRSPDSTLLGPVGALPKCTYNRHYVADGINHDVFLLYY
jgi:hypothetical protein